MIADEAKRAKAEFYADYIRGLCVRKTMREAEIADIRGELGLSRSALLGDRVQTSPSADAVPNAVIKLDELIDRYTQELQEYVYEIIRFRGYLDDLEPSPARVLHLRYLNGLEYKQISGYMHYTERNIYNLRDAGLIALYDLMPECWRSTNVPNAT